MAENFVNVTMEYVGVNITIEQHVCACVLKAILKQM